MPEITAQQFEQEYGVCGMRAIGSTPETIAADLDCGS